MAPWVSFKTIKEQVGIEQILAHYGLLQEAKRTGHELRIRCPFHEDTQPSFTAHTQKNGFRCFGCSAKGNIFGFVRLKEGIDTGNVNQDDRHAAVLIAAWFGIASERPAKEGKARADKASAAPAGALARDEDKRAHAEPPPLVNPPLTFTFKHLDSGHAYLTAGRGLTAETMASFGVGYHAGRGIMSGRVVIPVHNERGELVAYAGRWLDDQGWPEGEEKYKLPPGFHKSLVVFNLHRVRDVAREQGLILVEGFFDVMWLWQCGVQNAVALMGSSMSAEQERLIVETASSQGRVALMLDEDAAGRRCRDEVLSRLASHVYVKVIRLGEEGMQPDRLAAEDITRLLG
jgi:DNA primase